MIDKYNTFNSRIKRTNKPYKILVKYEHGDADFVARETFGFDNEADFKNILNFFYEILNFVPGKGYGGLGYCYPLTRGYLQGHCTEDEEYDKLLKIANKYNLGEDDIFKYLQTDNHYNAGYASIEGVKVEVNGENKVLVFKKALETNIVDLPNINIDVNRIPGVGKNVYGGNWNDYMPNTGMKDYLVPNFTGKVVDCSINFNHDYENEYYHEYTSFNYVLLVEVDDPTKILKEPTMNKLVYSIHGYDPNFEKKFKKEKYDGLNYYEIE